tara:strand:- start:204 stop:413 length:210 start_codon:yes stop_codon:yes gene_type:complete
VERGGLHLVRLSKRLVLREGVEEERLKRTAAVRRAARQTRVLEKKRRKLECRDAEHRVVDRFEAECKEP